MFYCIQFNLAINEPILKYPIKSDTFGDLLILNCILKAIYALFLGI